MSYRCPTEEELKSPLFESIWQAIKGWDIQRAPEAGRCGATGNHVAEILDAIGPIILGSELRTKLHNIVDRKLKRELCEWDAGYNCGISELQHFIKEALEDLK